MCFRGEHLFLGLVVFISRQARVGSETTQCTPERFQASLPCGSDGFQEYQVSRGTCILIKSPDVEVTWTQASEACRLVRGELVRLDNRELDTLVKANLNVSQNGYHIGLRKFEESGKFRWQGDKRSATPEPTWMNWAPREPSKTSHLSECAYKDSADGFWRTGSCQTKRSYICERASRSCQTKRSYICERTTIGNFGRPELTVSFLSGSTVLYVGKIYTINCAAFVLPDDPSLSFTITKVDGSVHTAGKNRRLRIYRHKREYIEHSYGCLLREKMPVTANLSKDMENSTFSCCQNRQDGFQRCTSWRLGELLFLPRPPEVSSNIADGDVYLGGAMEAKCSAYVGSRGELRWSLDTSHGTRWWKIDIDGKIYILEPQNKWIPYFKGELYPNLPAEFTATSK
ncbi:macrophage mannose receptor 1 [Elysia marginata]|uniref:Macrophage mannose receptor 1 n=1 Tax=Elysia marginata TaxID=1093978 RepID=A0AAV4I7R0_9GAST|nr:macrophage mannose receptor 1 [Elysia marginata]